MGFVTNRRDAVVMNAATPRAISARVIKPLLSLTVITACPQSVQHPTTEHQGGILLWDR